MIHGNAERVFAEILPDGCAIAVHIYFPDPWWKKRHHKRRVMNDQFLRQVERVLQAGGSLHFWTDVEEYFVAAVERIRTVTTLSGPISVPEREAQHDLDFQTHFERRTRLARRGGFPERIPQSKPLKITTEARRNTEKKGDDSIEMILVQVNRSEILRPDHCRCCSVFSVSPW